MKRYSRESSSIKPHYQVVIVGSGYGGGVAASRLARAGYQVCVLERGKEFSPGEFPDNELEAAKEMRLHTPEKNVGDSAGLYNFHIHNDITVITGSGLGGTSLINAGVTLEPNRYVLEDSRWPTEFKESIDTLLKDGFKYAKEMLKVCSYPENYPPLSKLEALKKSANYMGDKAIFYRPEIAVNFKKFKNGKNHVGVLQQPCINCGDCVSGCNYSSKNTINMNYIPDSYNFGAEIFTQTVVSYIEKKSDHYIVYYHLLVEGQEIHNEDPLFIKADKVILAAGSLGSTEILLRSKAKGLSLSNQVGQHFTGNGDVIGFGYNTNTKVNGIGFGNKNIGEVEAVGPTITGIIDMRNQMPFQKGIVIEDGALPSLLSNMLPKAFSIASNLVGVRKDKSIHELLKESEREMQSMMKGSYKGALQNTQTYLVMAHDDSLGKMYLKNEDGPLCISWSNAGKQLVFKRINTLLKCANEALKGGTYIKNPFWSNLFNNRLITVHPLGGCCMAEDAERGVVNHKGQVFSSMIGEDVHKGLYVLDGSIIPRSLGVNPLLTITAIAERNVYLLAKEDRKKIDYEAVSIPKEPQTNVVGLQFTESMKGFFSTKVKKKYQDGYIEGKKEQSTFKFILTIHIEDINKMLRNSLHQAKITGTIRAPELSNSPIIVADGLFNILVDDRENVKTKKMIYNMKLITKENKVYFLEGFKTIHNDNKGLDLWEDTTTLYITIYEEENEKSSIFGKGILYMDKIDFLKELRTIRVLNEKNKTQQLETILKFGKFFTGSLFDVYGGIFTQNYVETNLLRKKRLLRIDAPEVYYIKTDDQLRLRLIRYKGGEKGPVLLIHGLGVSSSIFTIDSIECNLTEYLFLNGYDVWLLDWRASIVLPYHHMQFHLDEVAKNDIVASVKKVRELTNVESIHVIAHCVGGIAFLMSMMNGLKGIASIVISQVGTHLYPHKINKIKANLYTPNILKFLGINELKAYVGINPSWKDKILDNLLKFYPVPIKEHCSSTICHRTSFMYGLLYQHTQLNELTHENLHELLGGANVTTFNQLALMFRNRKIVGATGRNNYLINLNNLAIPITFIHGEKNSVYLPKSTEVTYKVLCEKNGRELYKRHVIDKYGHLDCIIGKNAAQDVFPLIVKHLEENI